MKRMNSMGSVRGMVVFAIAAFSAITAESSCAAGGG